MIENQKSAISQEVNQQNDDDTLNDNKAEYIQHLVSKFKIDPLEIHRDQLTVSSHEKQIPAEMRDCKT